MKHRIYSHISMDIEHGAVTAVSLRTDIDEIDIERITNDERNGSFVDRKLDTEEFEAVVAALPKTWTVEPS
jgi:hypothetical protein